jgi:non-ribosomal peptide synthetase component E (peptide arylation enzyme)
MGSADLTVYDLVERGSELYPESLSIIDGERRIRYGEFRTLVDSLANGPKLQGLGERRHVWYCKWNRV